MANDTLAAMVVDGHLEQLQGWPGDLHRSWSVVHDLVLGKPEVAWPLQLELVRRCPDENLNKASRSPRA